MARPPPEQIAARIDQCPIISHQARETTLGTLVDQAYEVWTRAPRSRCVADWAAYGDAQRRLEETLKALRERVR